MIAQEAYARIVPYGDFPRVNIHAVGFLYDVTGVGRVA